MVLIAEAIGGKRNRKFFLECAASTANLNMWNGGNQWSGWPAWLSFFRHIVKPDLDYSKFQHYEAAAIHGGPRVVHPDFCMVSDRPEILTVDDQNRPHNDTGPFCRWRDGFSLYAIHGVRVTRDIVENPEIITIDRINKEENIEVRRVMMARYGWNRYITDSGAKEIHRDDFGTLFRKEEPNGDPILCVKVVNSTPEADGSFKDYWLRVDAQLRPLPPGEWPQQKKREWFAAQEPQAMTAHAAVASTFGLRSEEYAPEIET